MTHEVSNHRKTLALDVTLYGVADIGHAITDLHGFDSLVERRLGDFQQSPERLRDLAHRHGNRTVPVETLHHRTEIQTHQITLANDSLRRGDTMHHLVVDGHTKRCRKATVTLESRFRTGLPDTPLRHAIQVRGRHTGLQRLAQIL